jgi:hypothetical protein
MTEYFSHLVIEFDSTKFGFLKTGPAGVFDECRVSACSGNVSYFVAADFDWMNVEIIHKLGK